jgi:hypothetical protein
MHERCRCYFVTQAVSSIAWLPWQPLPSFLSCGADGLLLWSLAPSFLEQRQLTVPDAAGAAFTAVCSAASSGCIPHSSMAGQELDPAQQAARQAEEAATAFAADDSGTIWQLAIGKGMCCCLLLLCVSSVLQHADAVPAFAIAQQPVRGMVAYARSTMYASSIFANTDASTATMRRIAWCCR